MCGRHQLLLFDCGYDIETGLFSTVKISLNKANIEADVYISYEAEIVEKDELQSELFETRVNKNIPITFCPMCGRKLKEE